MLSSGIKISAENKTILEESKDVKKTKKRPFPEAYQEVNAVLNKLRERISGGETDLSERITSIVENYLGAGKKITELLHNKTLVEARRIKRTIICRI